MASWEPHTNISEIEEGFVVLYSHILKQTYEKKLVSRDWPRQCSEALDIIRKLMSGMKDEEKRRYYNFVNYRVATIRFAYMFTFSIINTCTAYQHFLYHFNENEDVKRIIQSKRSIRICCLGGGPGVEAVAICKIINDFFTPTFPTSVCTESADENSKYQVSIHVTIADIYSQWESKAVVIMNAAKGCILDSERVRIETRYIQADLVERLKTHLEEEINEADIVTMVRLGNEIMERRSENISALCGNLHRIVKLLKIDSCLFIQESDEGPAFCHLKDSLCSSTSLANVNVYEDRVVLTPKSFEIIQKYAPTDLHRFTPVCDSRTSSFIWVQK